MPTKLRFIPLALSLALLTLGAGAAGARKSVVDYYQEIPRSLLSDDMRYELKRTKHGWSTHSKYSESAAERSIPVTVDTKNGFIELTDADDNPETNGSVSMQVSVFREQDGSPLIAITLGMSDGIASEGRIVFVAPDGGQWKAVTSDVFPALRLADFLEDPCLASLSEESGQMLGILFSLPRQGTTIRASVMIPSFGSPTPCPENVTRELKWDKKAGRFLLLERPNKPPH
ncbi:hypothetical protein ATI61_116206 [Archangium gephyra]|uniref:Uncharacterized protein n=1 Tax=Archangium gephyra TaxID=48 RepID=A0AAC8TGW1_9BACT|nr:hypothetical protein [Archangium gephyra]AKJ03961.1 Hypothetical protein AA314_05587 [Archangium gephyra]REG23734.1 hypothetical protein ATI61_116206 [Archangium gephyra]